MKISYIALLSLVLSACGGGSGGSADTAPSPSVVVYNDLQANFGSSNSSASATLCGHVVGPRLLEGTVSHVHDGDTITVSGSTVRLDSIDAPELTQNYGPQAQTTLSHLLLGQTVKVAYAKTDKYGRIVGTVFTSSCTDANLEQVTLGSAWYYRAYQCEISGADRSLFDQAESNAQTASSGLWAEANPISPWIYRNGVDATVPTCSSSNPSWLGNPLPPGTPAHTPPANNSCYTVYVNGYYRSNGTYVPPYTRKSPGCP